MGKFIRLSASLVFVLSVFFGQEAFGEQMPLDTFINEVGNKCDVFFTIEGAYPGKSYSDMVLGEKISFQSFPADIEFAVFDLTNSITNLTVIADTANKEIYHIIDKRLLGLNDYAMNQVLESIKFNGNAEDFVNNVKEKVPSLMNNRIYFGAIIILNTGTTISIDSKNVSVRDALSNGVNLNGYFNELNNGRRFYIRLIWESFTSLETLQTPVAFQGISRPIEN